MVADISDIRDYIAEDSAMTANRVIRAIFSAIAQLQVFPRSGRRGKVNGTYELVISDLPYIAVYLIEGNKVEVVAIVHMARSRLRKTIE